MNNLNTVFRNTLFLCIIINYIFEKVVTIHNNICLGFLIHIFFNGSRNVVSHRPFAFLFHICFHCGVISFLDQESNPSHKFVPFCFLWSATTVSFSFAFRFFFLLFFCFCHYYPLNWAREPEPIFHYPYFITLSSIRQYLMIKKLFFYYNNIT